MHAVIISCLGLHWVNDVPVSAPVCLCVGCGVCVSQGVHARSLARMHPHTHTCMRAHTHTCMRSHTHTHSHPHALARTHARTRSLALTHANTIAHNCTHASRSLWVAPGIAAHRKAGSIASARRAPPSPLPNHHRGGAGGGGAAARGGRRGHPLHRTPPQAPAALEQSSRAETRRARATERPYIPPPHALTYTLTSHIPHACMSPSARTRGSAPAPSLPPRPPARSPPPPHTHPPTAQPPPHPRHRASWRSAATLSSLTASSWLPCWGV